MSGQISPKPHLFDLRTTLGRILTYGLNPYLVCRPADTAYLKELANSAIYKDLIDLYLINDRRTASDLLKLLAYQIGNLINYSDIASRLGIDVRTVQRYISIFEASFILYRLYPYTGNRRDEIGKAPKIYFYDTGIRNAVVEDFSDPFLRRDFAALFENFIISEIVKYHSYTQSGFKLAFWRTTGGAEIDLVLHKENNIIGCEIKASRDRPSVAFKNRYPKAQIRSITTSNFY